MSLKKELPATLAPGEAFYLITKDGVFLELRRKQLLGNGFSFVCLRAEKKSNRAFPSFFPVHMLLCAISSSFELILGRDLWLRINKTVNMHVERK